MHGKGRGEHSWGVAGTGAGSGMGDRCHILHAALRKSTRYHGRIVYVQLGKGAGWHLHLAIKRPSGKLLAMVADDKGTAIVVRTR